jgi:hypothetical protein
MKTIPYDVAMAGRGPNRASLAEAEAAALSRKLDAAKKREDALKATLDEAGDKVKAAARKAIDSEFSAMLATSAGALVGAVLTSNAGYLKSMLPDSMAAMEWADGLVVALFGLVLYFAAQYVRALAKYKRVLSGFAVGLMASGAADIVLSFWG